VILLFVGGNPLNDKSNEVDVGEKRRGRRTSLVLN